MMPPEFWMLARPQSGQVVEFVREIESAEVWDGLLLTDSQHLNTDTYCALAVAAHVTERIGLGTGVTNPVTRNPAVTASAISAIQIESKGRAVLGIGRGDSSLGHLGLRPAKLQFFEDYVVRLQGYLKGEAVEQNGHSAAIRWMDQVPQKVPLDISATGSKVIALAGRLADWVTFAVGADIDRLQTSANWARQAQEKAGRDQNELRLSAYLAVAAHPDPATARSVISGSVASLAHFSNMHGKNVDSVSEKDAATIEQIGKNYDLQFHGDVRASHVQHLDDEFFDRFAISGKPNYCVERLQELLDTVPLERVVIMNRSRGADPSALSEVQACLEQEVLPALKS